MRRVLYSYLLGLVLLVPSLAVMAVPVYYAPLVDASPPLFRTALEACQYALPGKAVQAVIIYPCESGSCGSIGTCSTQGKDGQWQFSGRWLSATQCWGNARYFDDVRACVGNVATSDDRKDSGPCGDPCVGNPINPGNGNKWQREQDYAGTPPSGSLSLVRTYNSSRSLPDVNLARSFGVHWTSRYDASIKEEPDRFWGQTYRTCWRRTDNNAIWCEYNVPLSFNRLTFSILRGDGKRYYFNRSVTEMNTWIGDQDVADRLTSQRDSSGNITGWAYVRAASDETERYDAAGRLLSVTPRSGTVERLTYSNGATNDTSTGRKPGDAPACNRVHPGAVLPADKLLCVTDNWGRQIQFEYDARGRVVKMIDPANQDYLYEYDGPSGGCVNPGGDEPECSANNLTMVTYPDGKSKTYHYNETAYINRGVQCSGPVSSVSGRGNLPNHLTGITDENGVRFASWTYDCQGRATSSQHAGGTNKVELAYTNLSADGGSTTTVKHTVGDPANPQVTSYTLAYQRILDVTRNQSISAPCVECGAIKSRTYDANGNMSGSVDWNNNLTCFAYDMTRNLETARIEGIKAGANCAEQLSADTLALPARRITTEWDAVFHLPVKIAEPNRLTTFIYDDKGNLLTKTEQATSDVTGVQAFNAAPVGLPRTWSYTYNDAGQVLTIKEPRTDVDATTRYVYDAWGNLASITNAAGQVTSLSNYDDHGHAGRITSPNGMITDLTYSPRGWLTSKAVTAPGIDETTAYEYDGVGQLTRVTLPDGTFLYYSYDDAHRLVKIADNLGNTINYSLDLRGNRLAEEVRDSGDMLRRRVSRVYDTMSRPIKITGGMQ